MIYIYSDILPQFTCAMCGRCCRNDWLVTVDEAGYRRNREFFAGRGREDEFRAAFMPIEGGEPGEYAAIGKRPGGGCWFLTADNLCRLQREAGPRMLDSVCRLYPRYPVSTTRGVEITLSFSCPQVLRLLERTEPLAIVRAEAPPVAVGAGDYVAAVFPHQQPAGSLLRYYFELEHHFIDILQCRGLPLGGRLRFLQETVRSLGRTARDESPGRALDSYIRENYRRLDAEAGGPAASGPAELLLEHFFVNLVFKKMFYLYGLERTMLLFAEIWQRLAAARGRAAGGDDLERTREAVMEIEFEYCHSRRNRFRSGRRAAR